MQYMFDDLRGYEKQTLYIIGNGFDRLHDLPTSYNHFYHWLMGQGEEKFVAGLEELFPNKFGDQSLLWMDFEKALGEYDINHIFSLLFKGESTKWYPDAKKIIKDKLNSVINKIHPLLKQWAQNIDINKTEKKLPLSLYSKYFTFNYTRTLECVYGIPKVNICHIHGNCVSDNIIVVGHNRWTDNDEIEENEKDWKISETKAEICSIMNNLYKNCSTYAQQNALFFSSIKKFQRIVILGHSLYDIDKPYFGNICYLVDNDAHWHISKHKDSDEERIGLFLRNQRIKDTNRWIYNL